MSKSKQINVSFIHEMIKFNEIFVSLLAEKNELIVVIVPLLLIYDILMLVCSLIEIYHILIVNIIIEIKIGKELEYTIGAPCVYFGHRVLISISAIISSSAFLISDKGI